MLIFSDSFINVMSDDKMENFLNIFCFTMSIGTYFLLFNATYETFRDVLTMLNNWWQRGITFVVVQMASSRESFNNTSESSPVIIPSYGREGWWRSFCEDWSWQDGAWKLNLWENNKSINSISFAKFAAFFCVRLLFRAKERRD